MEPLLPREVEDALPADPKLQLQLALRLASRAFSSRDSSAQQEVSRLRSQLAARDASAAALEERAAAAEAEAARAREESRSLAQEVRRLHGEVEKAESVRRALLRSLGEGEGGLEEGVGGVERNTAAPTATENGYEDGFATPAATSFAFAAAAKTAASTGVGFDASKAATIPAWKSQAPTTTTTTATANDKMSGKDFFRQARARLSPARFDALMNIVRSLNGGRSSRTAALRAAAETLGGEDGGCADLVPVFEGLLSQRVPVD